MREAAAHAAKLRRDQAMKNRRPRSAATVFAPVVQTIDARYVMEMI